MRAERHRWAARASTLEPVGSVLAYASAQMSWQRRPYARCMKFAHADVGRQPRMTAFASRAMNGGCWVLAIALLGIYCGLRGYGEPERRAAIVLFLQPRGDPTAVELTIVAPTDVPPLDASARPQTL